jgi:hypothetical protein
MPGSMITTASPSRISVTVPATRSPTYPTANTSSFAVMPINVPEDSAPQASLEFRCGAAGRCRSW